MKHYCPTGRRNHGRPLKRLLDTWDRNGSTRGPTPWKIYDDDDDEIKWSHYRPSVDQRVRRGIALLFHDHGTRRGWVVRSMPQPHFTPRKDPVSILQEPGWAPGPVWMGRKSRPHRDPIPDCPVHSQSLHWLSYPAHNIRSITPNKPKPTTKLLTAWQWQNIMPARYIVSVIPSLAKQIA